MPGQPHRWSQRRAGRPKGTALILVLAALVLISAIVLAFLALSSLSRLVAFSSAGQARAGWLAQTSLGIIEGDLRQEIIAGSRQNGNPSGAVYNTGGVSVYVPATNATVAPQRVAPAVALTNPNLIKVSWATNAFWSGANYLANNAVAGLAAPVRSLAGNSTASTSLNQRSIPNSLWNEHYLLGTGTPSAANWQAPDWVILTQSGALDTNSSWVPASPTAANLLPILSNANSPYRAIGRYAYAIYDEGGLIDVNVAGNLLSSSQNTQRGRLDQIDLSQLYDSSSASPLIPAPTTLLNWRSPVSGTNSSSVPGSGGLFDPQQTFLNAAVASATLSDQRFTSRQDLINYATANPSVITAEALQYLTTFSRDENAPSWTPTVNGAAGGFYNYQANAESGSYTTSTASTVVNRDLANIRFANSGTIAATANIPAYTVTAGQPLLIQRFPLSRLTWIGRNGPANGATAADILRAFGLVYVSRGLWQYTSPDSTSTAVRIKSLNEVAALSTPRQPDFFELLQAGILNGSLGLAESYDTSPQPNIPGLTVDYFRDMADTRDMERSTSRQIMQIGVNLIDQVQTDNWPTTILFNWFDDPAMNVSCPQAWSTPPSSPPYIGAPYTGPASSANLNYLVNLYPGVVGVTDIPYIYSIFQTFYAHPNIGGVGKNNKQYAGIFQFVEMWNPHQPTGTYTSGPTQFRVRVEAGTSTFNTFPSGYQATGGVTCSNAFTYDGTTVNQSSGPQEIDFSTASVVDSYFRSPNILTTANSSSGPTMWEAPGAPYLPGTSVYMIPGGYTSTDPKYGGDGVPTQYSFYPSFFSTSPLPTYRVDYQDESGNWSTYPYQLLPEVCFFSYNDNTPDDTWYGGYCWGMYRPDPRGARWGLSGQGGNWRFNIVTPNSDNCIWGPPTAHYYQQPPYSSGDTPGDPANIFTAAYGGSYYGNLVWAFDNWNPPNDAIHMGNMGQLAYNQGGNVTHYTDTDGFLRSGDCIYGAGTYNFPQGMTLPSPNPDPRPIILHRPFRSVAEMGYAFRDMPWRTLDFFSSNSADGALLDLFTVNDNTVHAGTVDLNTRQVPVLQAILQGSMQTEATGTVLTTTQANSMAQALTNLTGGGSDGIGPLRNVSELATRYAPILSTSVAPWIKTQREAAVRTLAQIGNVRVWNLLIDLVVQSGRYPPNATSLNNFVVEGQRHYWLHVAIDRATGKVIDHSLEPVSE